MPFVFVCLFVHLCVCVCVWVCCDCAHLSRRYLRRPFQRPSKRLVDVGVFSFSSKCITPCLAQRLMSTVFSDFLPLLSLCLESACSSSSSSSSSFCSYFLK